MVSYEMSERHGKSIKELVYRQFEEVAEREKIDLRVSKILRSMFMTCLHPVTRNDAGKMVGELGGWHVIEAVREVLDAPRNMGAFDAEGFVVHPTSGEFELLGWQDKSDDPDESMQHAGFEAVEEDEEACDAWSFAVSR